MCGGGVKTNRLTPCMQLFLTPTLTPTPQRNPPLAPTHTMVLKYKDGNSEHVAHICNKKGYFWGGKIRFMTALDLNKCLKLIKLQRLLLTFALISKLPSNISTMTHTLIN